MPSKHGKRAVRISDGRCPKCGRTMGRYQHHPDWLPHGRMFFHWWDKCNPCGHVQLYAEAKEEPERKPMAPMAPMASEPYFRAAGAAMFDGKQWLVLDAEGNIIGVCLTRTEAWRLADSCGMIEVQLGGSNGTDRGHGDGTDALGGEQPTNSEDNSTT